MGFEKLRIFCMVLSVIIFYLTLNKAKKLSKRCMRSLLGISASLFVLGIIFFLIQYFVHFDTPKDAYKYAYGEDILGIIEGEKSAFIIDDEDGIMVDKTKKGWKIPMISATSAKCVKQEGDISIYVMQYENSDEYYVRVSNLAGVDLDVADNRNSCFYLIKDGENMGNYFAYVDVINADYAIIVDGEEILLF